MHSIFLYISKKPNDNQHVSIQTLKKGVNYDTTLFLLKPIFVTYETYSIKT